MAISGDWRCVYGRQTAASVTVEAVLGPGRRQSADGLEGTWA